MSNLKNLWEMTSSDGLRDMMCLLACDEKYKKSSSSDYERFAKVCEHIHDLDGNIHAEAFLKKLNDAIGVNIKKEHVNSDNAPLFWRAYNDKDTTLLNDLTVEAKHQISKNKKCVEKNNNIFDVRKYIFSDIKDEINTFSELSQNLINCYISRENTAFYVCLDSGDLIPPNRYLAELALRRLKSDEKCSNEEVNVLLCQIICELCCALKQEGICVEIDGDLRTIGDLAEYLSVHGMRARIYCRVDSSNAPEDVLELCLRSTHMCHISPSIKVTKNNISFIKSLAAIYPIGAVRFYE